MFRQEKVSGFFSGIAHRAGAPPLSAAEGWGTEGTGNQSARPRLVSREEPLPYGHTFVGETGLGTARL